MRRFNRFYTRQIGLVTEQYLSSPFSVPEARVIYELALKEEPHHSFGHDLVGETWELKL